MNTVAARPFDDVDIVSSDRHHRSARDTLSGLELTDATVARVLRFANLKSGLRLPF
jgi:hypothetical protein